MIQKYVSGLESQQEPLPSRNCCQKRHQALASPAHSNPRKKLREPIVMNQWHPLSQTSTNEHTHTETATHTHKHIHARHAHHSKLHYYLEYFNIGLTGLDLRS